MASKDNIAEKKKTEAIVVLKNSAAQWPSGYVSRTEIGRFTGGVLSPSYLANLDCSGDGPDGAFKIGRHVVYDKEKLTTWLIDRIQV